MRGPSERLSMLPPYPFKELDLLKEKERAKGKDIIDLGIGDPDQPTPPHIIEAARVALLDSKHHRYPTYQGMPSFREAVAKWYKDRFSISLDPDTEILALIGAKEGIAHLPLGFINPGDVVLVPSPGYPVYYPATILAGGIPYIMPLVEENGFLPDLEAIEKRVISKARLIFLNYPNNPTTGCANIEFLKRVVGFAKEHNILVVYDNPYSELYFDGQIQPSFLQIEGAKEVGVEIHSLSKTYNMTGWRIGMVCGNPRIISGLLALKSNLDSGVFQVVQMAGIAALSGPQDCVDEMRRLYQERRDTLVNGLRGLGWKVSSPKATIYLWVRIPTHHSSKEFSRLLLEETSVVVSPGIGFGEYGEGYIRMALTVDKERLEEAINRLSRL